MPNRLNPKREVDDDVLTLARRRYDFLYERFDKVVVGFSGGKDSTVCLQLAMEAADRFNRLPVDAYFIDEEAVPPETIDYVARMANNPGVRMHWMTGPVKHRNACSTVAPWWYCWGEEDRDLWVRPLPEGTIRGPQFRKVDTSNFCALQWGPECGRVANVVGLRTQESLNRYQAVANNKSGFECFMGGCSLKPYELDIIPTVKHITRAFPIFDWTHEDVWLAPFRFGWDYNRSYDLMAACGVTLHEQRVAPPFGEQPLQRLWTYQLCWPELWEKMIRRVPGAATAARYARTELYGKGNEGQIQISAGSSWQDTVYQQLTRLEGDDRLNAARNMKSLLTYHAARTNDPMPETERHPESGLSWREMAAVVMSGDLKGGRRTISIKARANQWVQRSKKKK